VTPREAEPPKSAPEGSLEPIVGLSHRQEHPANQGHPTQQSLLCRNSRQYGIVVCRTTGRGALQGSPYRDANMASRCDAGMPKGSRG
jgi:hypothetical protein